MISLRLEEEAWWVRAWFGEARREKWARGEGETSGGEGRIDSRW